MKHGEQVFRNLGNQINRWWIFSLLFPLLISCKESESNEGVFDPNAPVEVNSIIPETGIISLPLVISGKNFGTDKSKIKVYFDDIQAVIITAKNNSLYVLNPRQTDGEHTVKVVVDDKEGVWNKKFKYIVTSSVKTVAGNGSSQELGNTPLETPIMSPYHLAVDNKRNIIVYSYSSSELKLISLEDNKVSVLSAHDYSGLCFSKDYSRLYAGVDASSPIATEWDCNNNWASSNITSTEFKETTMIVLDGEENLYLINEENAILKRDKKTGTISQVGEIPDSYIGSGSLGFLYAAYNPQDNHIYFASPRKGIIFRIDASKESFNDISDFEIYAGILGELGFNEGPRMEAVFGSPRGLAFDSRGYLYVADGENNVIRKISPDGIVSTLTGKYTGTGNMGGYKDGSLEEALFFNPYDISIDPDDVIYVAERFNNRVRCISVQ